MSAYSIVDESALQEMKEHLLSDDGLKIVKVSRMKKQHERVLLANETFTKFTIGGGKSRQGRMEFPVSEIEMLYLGNASPELRKLETPHDPSVTCCIKLKKRFISLVFEDELACSNFCSCFARLARRQVVNLLPNEEAEISEPEE
eukprot:Filipodium_phascolosomae@DN1378_c0_g1_i2.p1